MGQPKLGGRAARLDRLKPSHLTRWWTEHITTYRTGDGYLHALSGAVEWARVRGEYEGPSPVADARAQLKRFRRTAATRARDEDNCRPLTRDQMAALAVELEGARPDVRALGFLLLDAGLHLGEVKGLRWRDCCFGDGPMDTRRHFHIRESKDASGRVTTTKSGRSRKVAMSRRLQRALRELKLVMGRPKPSTRVLPGRAERTWRTELQAAATRAGIKRQVRPKDLRDTFASQLVSAGVQLPWVSRQLGRGNIAVTARHYAAWAPGDDYFASPQKEPGELPPDLLSTTVALSGTKTRKGNDDGRL